MITPRRGLYVVPVDGGNHAVFELLEGVDLPIGDRIQNNLDALGGGPDTPSPEMPLQRLWAEWPE